MITNNSFIFKCFLEWFRHFYSLLVHQLVQVPLREKCQNMFCQNRVFSGPYFPAFGLNTERYFVSLCTQSECSKIRTRKNSVFGLFSRSVPKVNNDLFSNNFMELWNTSWKLLPIKKGILHLSQHPLPTVPTQYRAN